MLLVFGLAGPNLSNAPGSTSEPYMVVILRTNTKIAASWIDGTLQSATDLNDPWTTLSNATSPTIHPATGASGYFRLH